MASGSTASGSDEFVFQEKDGLSLATLEDMLSDIRYQPQWREEADVAGDYVDGHQLKSERLARMEKLGIPPLVTNLIAPVVNSVLGMEAKSRTDWRVTSADEAQEAPEELMLALNAKLNESERESRADMAISEAYASMIKTGVGWVEVSRDADALKFPYRVAPVHRNEIWWDWRTTQPDQSDMRYLVRKKRFDHDELIAFMPEHADLIKWAVADRFKTWQWETTTQLSNTDLAYAAHIERITNIDENEWRDADRKRATVFEVWYRKWKRAKVLELPNGDVILFDAKNQRHVEVVRAGYIRPVVRVFTEVRLAFYLGCHRLYDLPSPYPHRHFPYVPWFGYKEDRSGIRYGIVRAMISPQDVVNSSDSKMHWLLSAKRLTADSDAIDTNFNSWRQVQDNLASPNSVVLLDPKKPKSRYKVESDFALNAQQFSRRMQAANDIESAAGIYKAMMGQEGAATSGVGINSLIEQSTVMMAEINDNHSFARRQVGELLFSLVKEDLLDRELPVAIKQHGKKSIITLNKRVLDSATGQEAKENDVSRVKIKVILEDIPSTASFKAQQLRITSEVAKSLPPQMQAVLVPAMIKLTDIPDKEETAELLKKMAGIGPKLSEEEQAAVDAQDQKVKQDVADLQQRTAMAQLAMLESKVDQLKQQNEKTSAEKVAKMVEAIYSAMQSGQLVATMPNVAPIADEILRGAGYKDGSLGIEAPAAAPQPNNQPLVQEGPPSSPFTGERKGIETLRNDGIR